MKKVRKSNRIVHLRNVLSTGVQFYRKICHFLILKKHLLQCRRGPTPEHKTNQFYYFSTAVMQSALFQNTSTFAFKSGIRNTEADYC